MVVFASIFVVIYFLNEGMIWSCRILCIWVEVSLSNKKHLIGTFYRPPNSPNVVLSSIENSVSLALDTNIQNILLTGDFNFDTLKETSYRKIHDLTLSN